MGFSLKNILAFQSGDGVLQYMQRSGMAATPCLAGSSFAAQLTLRDMALSLMPTPCCNTKNGDHLHSSREEQNQLRRLASVMNVPSSLLQIFIALWLESLRPSPLFHFRTLSYLI